MLIAALLSAPQTSFINLDGPARLALAAKLVLSFQCGMTTRGEHLAGGGLDRVRRVVPQVRVALQKPVNNPTIVFR